MFDCIIIGGGIAGLQAAIQLGRYSSYRILVIDKGTGRSTLCKSYHNILGWSDGISGDELRKRGKKQAEAADVEFVEDTILNAESINGGFVCTGQDGTRYEAKTLLLATGLTDRIPHISGLKPTLGESVYVCPDCDGFEIQNRKTVVLGSGKSGAGMAIMLSERTNDLTYINHERTPVDEEGMRALSEKGIRYIEQEISGVDADKGMIQGIQLANGGCVAAERGFISFGGNKVHSELAAQLGAELEHNQHVKADPRTRMSSVARVWIAGDLGVHSELATAAMGDGTIAAIWINKELKKMKQF
ncbi:NAD(P)/FAD-dependent oxidoreductase [Paenibacillus lemnae]|uniref:NAD(P)/FAD-dependent oxidoreductase n=1 Tax=Paenibacillus lemnae TaxID=1330551 RepID=A0A848M6P8_PAELE|nr:NAD(P)/FAD-dependent oxidoreductase [Paenibacillus lemnae]NMO96306.1 NAD(P)/FAD-dependent oxidoreductase [Paenibacillus lemnae]